MLRRWKNEILSGELIRQDRSAAKAINEDIYTCETNPPKRSLEVDASATSSTNPARFGTSDFHISTDSDRYATGAYIYCVD